MKKLLTLICFLGLSYFPCYGQISWGTPTMISTSGVNASDPHVVTDANGNATAIWLENGVVKASAMPIGGSWGAVATLSNVLDTSSNPRLKIDGNGNAIAIWIDGGIVYTSTLPLGGSWSVATALSNALGGASEGSLAVDSVGDIVAIWTRNGYIESSQNPLSLGVWSLVSQLSSNGTEDHPDVYIGEGGVILAVWHSVVSGNDILYSSTGAVNGSWGSPVDMLAATPGAHHNYPRVVVDSNGNATAIWYRYEQSGTDYSQVIVLGSSLSSSSSTWDAIPTQLSNSGMFDPSKLKNQMTIDGNGNVLAMWTNSYDGSTFSFETGELPYGGMWQTPSTELVSQDPYAFSGEVSATSFGACVVNFMTYDGTNIKIQSSETSINGIIVGSYNFPTFPSQGTLNGYPSVSTAYQSSSGLIYGVTAWENNNGSNNIIQASVGTNNVVTPPSNLTAVQNVNNYGIFTEYYNTVTWTASTYPNVIQYIVYRNGVALEILSSQTTEYIDHNAVQNQAVTYGVSAVISNEILSPMAIYDLTFP